MVRAAGGDRDRLAFRPGALPNRTRSTLRPFPAGARDTPVLHAHINPYGRYRFDVSTAPDPGLLRPLNAIDHLVQGDVPTTPIPLNRD